LKNKLEIIKKVLKNIHQLKIILLKLKILLLIQKVLKKCV